MSEPAAVEASIKGCPTRTVWRRQPVVYRCDCCGSTRHLEDLIDAAVVPTTTEEQK